MVFVHCMAVFKESLSCIHYMVSDIIKTFHEMSFRTPVIAIFIWFSKDSKKKKISNSISLPLVPMIKAVATVG